MSTEVGKIHYTLDLDDSKFQKGAKSATKDVGKLESAFKSAEKGSFALLGGIAAIGVGLTGFAKKAITNAANLETMRQGFVGLLKSTEKADEAIKMIIKDAATTPFEVEGLIKANQLLTAITKDAGQSEKMLLNVGKALAGMGKGQEELDRIIVNLQQIGAVGKASMLDIKQFAFAGIPIFEMLTEATGKSGEALEEMIKEGGITFDVLEKMFEKAGTGAGRFANAFEVQGGTFNQVFSNLKDSFYMLGIEIVTSTGLFESVKNTMKRVSAELVVMSKEIEEAGGFTEYLKEKLYENEAAVYAVASAITLGLVPALGNLAIALLKVSGPFAPFLIIGALLGVLINEIVVRLGGWEIAMDKVRGAMEELWNKVTPFLPTIEQLSSVLDKLEYAWGRVLAVLRELRLFIETQIVPIFRMLWGMIEPYLVIALQVLEAMIREFLIPALREMAKTIGPYLVPMLKVLVVALAALALTIATVVLAVFGAFLAILYVLVAAMTMVAKAVSWAVKQIEYHMSILAFAIVNIASRFKVAFGVIENGFNILVGKITYAVNKIKAVIDSAAETMKKLNPLQRFSPSLVDNVKRGTHALIKEYSGLFSDIDAMSSRTRFNLAGATGSVSNITQVNTPQPINVSMNVENYYGDQIGLTNFTEKLMQEIDRINITRNNKLL